MENTHQNDAMSDTIDGVNVISSEPIVFTTLQAGTGISITDNCNGVYTVSTDNSWKQKPRIRQCYE